MTKQTYEAPKLTAVGSLEALTQGGKEGNKLDASFPTNTPSGQLTFS